MVSLKEIKANINSAINNIAQSATKCDINKLVENLVTDITDAEYSSLWIYDGKYILNRHRECINTQISIEKKKVFFINVLQLKKQQYLTI
ncbi:MAG: hypothetical protein U9O86_07555 [Campylobacterota bacterium]|nr:hypothetical protein [Campylobacterota bacterium]